ncbi:hypothetical protein GBAR_LOCUS7768 [Geodia barretti]|uniref:Uncharacterized protein n=1 Tax=Geodia barretti TaxID=519541 RepID=A0AA35RIF6_GEOBA|nr:hypothetical protein GBAR_LOCUS7768 [Geodia barretti]
MDVPARPVATSDPVLGREYTTILHYRNILVETISRNVLHFSIKLCEKKLISNEVNSEMASMNHVGEKEKADILLKKTLTNLSISEPKEKLFHEFTAIFSAEVSEGMEEFYTALKMIDDAVDAIGRTRSASGCIADVDDMSMLYKTLKIAVSRQSNERTICHCSFQMDLTIRLYPLVLFGTAAWFACGVVPAWSLGFGGGLGGPIGAAVLAAAMDRFVGQYATRGFDVNRDGMIVIPGIEILQSIPSKNVDDGSKKKLHTFIHTLPHD